MNIALSDRLLPSGTSPTMTIITTREDGQVRAAVVYFSSAEEHKVMKTLFQGSLAQSDSEALLSLYEASKLKTTAAKNLLVSKGWWRA
jgi:hypothetical protein